MTKSQRPTDAETDQTQPGQTAGAEPDDLTSVDVDDAAVMALLKGLDEEGDIPSGPAFLAEEMPDGSMTPAQMAAMAAALQPQNDDAAMLMSAPPPLPARAPRRPRPSKLEATEAVAHAPVEESDEDVASFAASDVDYSAPVDYADPLSDDVLGDASEPAFETSDAFTEVAAYDDIDSGAVEDVAEPMAAPAASMSMDMFEEEEPKDNGRAAPVYDANVKRFMFERDFEAELRPAPPKPQEPIPEQPTEVLMPDEPVHPPTPMFSAEELHAARMAAYADGETTGLQTAMGSIDSKIARALEQIGAQLPSLQHDREQVVHSVSEEAARLAHAMVARMFPEMARRYGLTEIQAVIADCIEQAIDQPRIIIRLHPDLAPVISEKAEHMAMMAGYAGRLSVLPEATLGPSDIRLEWGDGGAERLISRAWADISDIVGRAVTHLAETVPSDQDSGLSAA